MLLGLASVTFDNLTVDDTIHIAKQNGLLAVEWSERHVARGDIKGAERVGRLTREAGMKIVSYGSCFSVLEDAPAAFSQVLATAKALGTDTVTLNAGHKGQDFEGNAVLERFATEAVRLAEMAENEQMKLCFSYRHDSLLDDYMRATQLMEAIGRGNVFLSWQPNQTSSLIYNIFELKMLARFVHNVYVFYVDAASRHTPIIEEKDEWQQYLKVLKAKEDRALLFKTSNAHGFSEDCALMQEWVTEICPAIL